MNGTVTQIIPVIRENRKKFEEFCFSLSEEELARPVPDSDWIVKDFASHLATLDPLFADWIDNVRAGGMIDVTHDAGGAPFSLDSWNDAQVAERRNWTIRRIFDEADTNRERLITALNALNEEQVAGSMHFSDPKRGSGDLPLKAFLVGWAWHDPIHAADMVKALPERAGDAKLTAWFAHPFVTGYQVAMSGPVKA